MKFHGFGNRKDFNGAFELFKETAKEGSTFGQRMLAACYYHGKGVPQNYRLSYIWSSICYSGGEELCLVLRGLSETELRTGSLEAAQLEALQLSETLPKSSKTQSTEVR